MTLVERAGQLARLGRLVDNCQERGGGIAVIGGPVGVGKTELLHAFVARATASGATVLEGAGVCAESEYSLGLLRQIVGGLPTADRDRVRSQLRVDALALACETEAAAADHLRIEVRQLLCETLRDLSARTPVVIAVDDLQFVDAASRDCLLYLAGRLASARVLMVFTMSEGLLEIDRSRTAWYADLLRQPALCQVPVGPLSLDGVARIVAALAPSELVASLAPAVHELSGGNPLLVRALLEDTLPEGSRQVPRGFGDEGATCPDQPVPGSVFARAVVTCAHRGTRMLAVARALAVLEESDSSAVLRRLVAAEAEVADSALGALSAAGLLCAGRFRHPAARAAVLADLATDERAALHRRAARLLYREGAAAGILAIHLVAAGRADEPWALDVLCKAAEESLRTDNVAFAAACLGLAVTACADEAQRRAVTLLRARAEFRTNPGAAFRHLAPLVDALRAGELPDEEAIGLVRPLILEGRCDTAADVLRHVEHAAAGLSPAVVSELHLTWEWLSVTQPGVIADLGRPSGWSHGSVPPSVVAGPALAVASAMTRLLRGGGGESDAVDIAERVLQAAPLDDATFCSLDTALYVLIYADRADLARSWCDSLLREAELRGAPTWQALFAAARAEVALRRGELAAARRFAQAALTHIPAWSWGVAVGGPLSVLLAASAAMGEHDTLDPREMSVPDAMFQTRFGAQFLHARGQVHLAAGRPHAALDDLLTCGRLLGDWGLDLPAFVPWRVEAVTALLRLGRGEPALRLAEEHLDRAGSDHRRSRGMALRALASAVEPRRRMALLREAVEMLETSGDRQQIAAALADLANVYRRLGQANRARMVTRRATMIAADCQAVPLHRQLLAQGGGGAAHLGHAGHPHLERPEQSGLGGGVWDGQPSTGEPDGRIVTGGPLATAGVLASDRIASDRPEAGAATGGGVGLDVLSAAELQVATLAAAGHTNREIAGRLFITVSTVEQHLTRTYRKLRVAGRADLPVSLNV
ncbi:Regulatory protein LuxR [Frankia sp. Hr75.2]|nr:Regulatory protein LuxR [Frankia sp. Hr75.2]